MRRMVLSMFYFLFGFIKFISIVSFVDLKYNSATPPSFNRMIAIIIYPTADPASFHF